MSEWLAAFGSIVGFLLMMILIFVGAYYATKMLGKHYSKQGSSTGGIRVIDRLTLGRDRYLLIVEAGDKTLLLGVSQQHVDALAELDSMAFADLPPVQGNTDFLSLLKNRIRKPEGQDPHA